MSDSLRDWVLVRFLPHNLKVRDQRTRDHYERALNDFAEFLGREPLLSDLTDEALSGLILHLLSARELAECTANERAGRIRTFWNWAAKKRKLTGVEEFPGFHFAPEPEKIPIAWREDELIKLFNACRNQRGEICGIPAWRWWFSLHGFWWCTGERTGATLAMRCDHLRLDEKVAVLPAAIRKGKRKPAVHRLWDDLVAMLRMILPPYAPARELVFPWPRHHTTFYYHYGRMLRQAGLPDDRYSKPQKMRVSHASWRHLAGQDATAALGHNSSETTRRHYLDPTLLKQDESKLFRPW